MDHFEEKDGQVFCEELPLKELAADLGTPTYVYSYATIERHFRVFQEALEGISHLICYSVKANSNLAILRALARFGSGADVVSGGELFRCFEAGIPSDRVVFSGVGKSLEELEYAFRRKILMINVESEHEYELISQLATALKEEVQISFRLNPDIDPKTHPYISTGMKENKFGLTQEKAMRLYKQAAAHAYVQPVGLDFHIGSQLTDVEPFREAMNIALDVVRSLRSMKIDLRYLDMGGGLGIRYIEEDPPSPKELAEGIRPLLDGMDLTLILEPGRSIVGNAGVLLTKVLYVKKTPEKNFIVVDAAMNDLLRPSLYGAKHEVAFVQPHDSELIEADVVGPICESGDFLAKGIKISEPKSGDLLFLRSCGAYAFSMSSQYNSRPRALEALVNGEQCDIVRNRENFDDLIEKELIPRYLEEEL